MWDDTPCADMCDDEDALPSAGAASAPAEGGKCSRADGAAAADGAGGGDEGSPEATAGMDATACDGVGVPAAPVGPALDSAPKAPPAVSGGAMRGGGGGDRETGEAMPPGDMTRGTAGPGHPGGDALTACACERGDAPADVIRSLVVLRPPTGAKDDCLWRMSPRGDAWDGWDGVGGGEDIPLPVVLATRAMDGNETPLLALESSLGVGCTGVTVGRAGCVAEFVFGETATYAARWGLESDEGSGGRGLPTASHSHGRKGVDMTGADRNWWLRSSLWLPLATTRASCAAWGNRNPS